MSARCELEVAPPLRHKAAAMSPRRRRRCRCRQRLRPPRARASRPEPATYFGLRGAGDIRTTYAVSAVALLALYPACRWYRTLKAAHPRSMLKYF
ncbi:MAG TPA: hypothetical protein VFV10_16445 [Gammaproteobacteria bacterium]|nr:hypothetical protein [Gammaproteobacteria bacterium]